MSKAGRRSAKEWARGVREWERSGQPAGVFAATHGLRPKTLVGWRWRLRQAVGEVARRAKPESVQLLRVQLQDEAIGQGAVSEGDVAWELAAPSGHVLRVYNRDAELLRAALTMGAHAGRLP
jgi:hypothetical protein